MDPFTSHNTLILFCDILDAVKKSPYERDPRGTAKKAEEFLKNQVLVIKLTLVLNQNFLFLMTLELTTIQITLVLK